MSQPPSAPTGPAGGPGARSLIHGPCFPRRATKVGEHRNEKTIEEKEDDGGAASRREALATIGPAGARAARSPFYGLCQLPGATTIGEHRNEKSIDGVECHPLVEEAERRWRARGRLALAASAPPTTPFDRALLQREGAHRRVGWREQRSKDPIEGVEYRPLVGRAKRRGTVGRWGDGERDGASRSPRVPCPPPPSTERFFNVSVPTTDLRSPREHRPPASSRECFFDVKAPTGAPPMVSSTRRKPRKRDET